VSAEHNTGQKIYKVTYICAGLKTIQKSKNNTI